MKARFLVQIAAPAWALLACGGYEPEAAAPPGGTAEAPAAAPIAPTAPPSQPEAPSDAEPAEPLGAVEIRALAAPPAPAKMPSVKLVAPRPNEQIRPEKAADYLVKLEVADWPVAPGGAHLHLILDNEPYLAVYEPEAAIKLGDIALGASLGEGQHVIAAFPSRDTHVAVKPEGSKSPLAIAAFTIGKGGRAGALRIGDPTLVYSRPKGTYNGAHADEIVVDWYLINAELGDKRHSVRVTVTPPEGAARTKRATKWAPLAIVNLPNGETKVKLELLDRDGKLVPGPWNSTERTITVNRDAR